MAGSWGGDAPTPDLWTRYEHSVCRPVEKRLHLSITRQFNAAGSGRDGPTTEPQAAKASSTKAVAQGPGPGTTSTPASSATSQVAPRARPARRPVRKFSAVLHHRLPVRHPRREQWRPPQKREHAPKPKAGPGPVMARPAQPSAGARQLAKADPPPLPLVTSQKAAAQAMALSLSWSHSCRDSFASAQEVAPRLAEGG